MRTCASATCDTGNTLAAASGASLKQLMTRMGHSSIRAALIYQHVTEDGDQAIADALGDVITQANVAPFERVIEKPGVQRLGD